MRLACSLLLTAAAAACASGQPPNVPANEPLSEQSRKIAVDAFASTYRAELSRLAVMIKEQSVTARTRSERKELGDLRARLSAIKKDPSACLPLLELGPPPSARNADGFPATAGPAPPPAGSLVRLPGESAMIRKANGAGLFLFAAPKRTEKGEPIRVLLLGASGERKEGEKIDTIGIYRVAGPAVASDGHPWIPVHQLIIRPAEMPKP